MNYSRFLSVAALSLSVLAGCQIVYEDETSNLIPPGPEGDEQRATILVDETFQARLVPHIVENAHDISSLVEAIEIDLDATGKKYGFRGADRTAAWNFPVKGTGTIVANKLVSRARNFSVDFDGDGEADLKLQLGPVIKGTALRDVAPFYDFNDFRDQIEFAKLGRVLNNKASSNVDLDADTYVGQHVTFVGVFPYSTSSLEILLTPVKMDLGK